MRVTIVADDGLVGVDGMFRTVDLSALDGNIHAVQWDGAAGHVEHKDRSPELKLAEISAFQSFIDAWTAAAPAPSTLAELKRAKGAEFVAEAVARIAAQVPDWDSLDAIKTVAGLWTSHLAANATAAQTKAKDIYLYASNTARLKLVAATLRSEIDAIDPGAADPFGDGTPWPT